MTAVEWLHEKLAKSSEKELVININLWFKQAKEMEKQQIIDAWIAGYNSRVNEDMIGGTGNEEYEYYKETFGESTPWYDEDKTTERMNVIGQNGNDGEHY